MRRFVLVLMVCLGLWWGAGVWQASGDSQWVNVGNGIESRSYFVLAGTSRIPIYAFRASASRVQLASKDYQDADGWREKTGARIAINGGYFDEENRPLGLRVSNQRKLSSLRQANWGVFYVRKNVAFISHTRDYAPSKDTQMAVQCGPRLVVRGKVTDLKPQWGRRSGIGIDERGRVVVAVADGEMSFDLWAKQWASADGLDCRDALNLDGGGSTQLSVSTDHKKLEVNGLWSVPDAIIIR